MAHLLQVVERRFMGWNDRIDPYDSEDSFDDEYFDGDDLEEDLLYLLFDADEYDILDDDE